MMPELSQAGEVVKNYINYNSHIHFGSIDDDAPPTHTYTTHPKQWPPLVEVVDRWELPAVLKESYLASRGEGIVLSGTFPEIRRAWATIDNTLFLWRFDKRDKQCSKYSANQEAICAVGLAKPKARVFVKAFQYVLVLATPAELILVGVCYSGTADGRDPYAKVSLQTLPKYRTPSDGIRMTCIMCTEIGRIFMAGRDGHIYELLYAAKSFWQKRCRKVCRTSGLRGIISRFGAVDPVVEMACNNEWDILYAKTEAMKLQVFYLSRSGGTFEKLVELQNCNHKEGRRPSTGARTGGSARPSIVCICPLSSIESRVLFFVAILSDGRRMYFSNGNKKHATTYGVPKSLEVVSTRPRPPSGVTSTLGFGSMPGVGHTRCEDFSGKAENVHYSAGTLFLSDPSPPAASSVLIVSKDYSAQLSPASYFGTTRRSTRLVRECVSCLPVEGRMLSVVDVLPLPDTAAIVISLYSHYFLAASIKPESPEKAFTKLWTVGELSMQYILPRRRVVVISTMGMVELAFNRPVDILGRLLESNSPRTVLCDFFNRYGAGQAAAMCLMLASKIVDYEQYIGSTVAEKAAEAYEDSRFVGMPATTTAREVRMGKVVEEGEPVFSGAYEGFCLCTASLLGQLWRSSVMIDKDSRIYGDPSNIVCRLSVEAMEVLENKLCSLEKFMRLRKNKRRGLYARVAGLGELTGSIFCLDGASTGVGESTMKGNKFGCYSEDFEPAYGMGSDERQRLPYSPSELTAMEVRATERLRLLLHRSSEALFLLQLLSRHNPPLLVQTFDVKLIFELRRLTFHELVCSEEGDMLATRLISALMEGTEVDISAKLREGCPSYFKKFDLVGESLEKLAKHFGGADSNNVIYSAFDFIVSDHKSRIS